MVRAFSLLTIASVLLSVPAAAGTFAGLTPGVSTKADADGVLGAPVREVVPGTLYDYDAAKFQARRISIRFQPQTQIIQTIDLYLMETHPRAKYVGWFELGNADQVTYDAYGNRVETYGSDSISLHFEGPEEDSQVLFFRHYSPGLSSGGQSTRAGGSQENLGGTSPVSASGLQPYLGVFLARYKGQGYRVVDVGNGSPAQQAGIRGGDVILEFEQLSFYQSELDPSLFVRFVATMPENQPLRMLIQRGNQRIEIFPVLELRDLEAEQEESRRFALDYYNEGAALAEKNKCKQAIPLLEKATQYNPKDVRAMEMLGYCEYRRGHEEEAFQLFQRALKLAPGTPMANYFVAAHYEEMEHSEKAILHYGLYLANDDGDKFRLKYARKHLGQLTGSRSSADWDKTVGVLVAVLQQELADGSFGTDAEQSAALQSALAAAQQRTTGEQQDGVTADRLWEMYEAIREETNMDQP